MLRGLLLGLLVVSVGARSSLTDDTDDKWWSKKLIYQINVATFKDSDGDTIGDLQGIIDNVDHLTEIGVKVVSLGYIYDSTDLRNINATFGNLTVFDNLVDALNKSKIHLILDFYLSGTSEEHQWFKNWQNTSKTDYTDFYVHSDKAYNWITPSGKQMWTKDAKRGEYYVNFGPGAHLDLRQDNVVNNLTEVMNTWLSRKVEGFRILDVSYLVQPDLEDEEHIEGCKDDTYSCYDHSITINRQENYDKLKTIKDNLNNCILIVEPYVQYIDDVTNGTEYLQYGADLVVNQALVNLTMSTPTTDLANQITSWMNASTDSELTWILSSRYGEKRVAARVGSDQVDSAQMIGLLLPGSHLGYFGDEIAMTADSDLPFQWNSSRNAGFTNSSKTIEVDPSYWEVNLKDEKKAEQSHYHVYKRLSDLREYLSDADNFTIYDINNLTFAFSRTKKDDFYLVLVNMDNMEETYSLTYSGSKELRVHTASVNSGFSIGKAVNKTNLVMRPWSGLVITDGPISGAGYFKISFTLLAFCLAWIHL